MRPLKDPRSRAFLEKVRFVCGVTSGEAYLETKGTHFHLTFVGDPQTLALKTLELERRWPNVSISLQSLTKKRPQGFRLDPIMKKNACGLRTVVWEDTSYRLQVWDKTFEVPLGILGACPPGGNLREVVEGENLLRHGLDLYLLNRVLWLGQVPSDSTGFFFPQKEWGPGPLREAKIWANTALKVLNEGLPEWALWELPRGKFPPRGWNLPLRTGLPVENVALEIGDEIRLQKQIQMLPAGTQVTLSALKSEGVTTYVCLSTQKHEIWCPQDELTQASGVLV